MRDKNFMPLIIFALIFLVSLGWWKFIYEPARREILNMELATRRLNHVEREIAKLKARHGDLEAFIEVKELELDAARNFLPSTLEQDNFIDELYRAAEANKVQLMAINANEAIAEKELQSQVVSVKLEADYISLLNFIRQILDGERLTTLERVIAEREVGNILSCELSFKIFATVP